ncbi:response regulator [Desulforhopalus sp. IMCC35007]|uniref:response regulator n=1 Tax=Desulforhopalus sp. IMCC35007 TaxID=2569543 RepID=UPI0010ADEC03|nr:response regulator [Desulforhopalus sp. IMCC35007]TKB06018.1 response regulator [Desulforhopalus sp. IMCC35007]
MNRKILFVDDDRVIQMVVEQQLAAFAEHFSLVFANDGLDAIKKLENGCFSLVCIDLIMPRMKGVNLFSHIRSHFPHVPAIIMSGKSKEEMQELIPPLGVYEYFSKPFEPKLLCKSIMKHLQKEAEGGIMYNVSPPVFFQFMEMEAKTCTARVLDNGSPRGGVLYFTDGQLLDVRVGMITGLDAAHIVFGWNDVTVFIEKNCPAIENRINLPLQTVIMQAVSMKDEDEEDIELQSAKQERGQDLADSPEGGISSKLRSARLGEISGILADEVAANSVGDISQRVEMTDAVQAIAAIGEHSNLGEFYLGVLAYGSEDDAVVIPSKPPVRIECSSESHAKGVVRKLVRKI